MKHRSSAGTAPLAPPVLPGGENQPGAQKPTSKLWNRIGSLLMLALITVVMIVVFRDTSIPEVWSAIRSVDPFWFALAIAASLLSSLMFGFALHISLRTLYGKRIPLLRSIGFGYIGQYYTAITPAGAAGQPMQLYYMCACGVEFSYASLSLLLVNAAHQIIVLLIPLALFPFRAGLILDNLGTFLWFLIFGTVVNVALILFLIFSMFSPDFARRAVFWIIGLLARLRLIKNRSAAEARTERQLQLYRHGADLFKRHPWLFAIELVAYVVLLGSQFIIPYFVYRAFGLNTYGVVDFVALQSVLFLAVCFLPLPGSAGASESGFVSLFRVLFQSTLIVPAMLLSRTVSFYLILLVSSVVSLLMQLLLTRRKRAAAENQEPSDSAPSPEHP